MALFSAFGKFISESGGPYILNECEVLAKGSLQSFQHGKNYKRLLALATESFHVESFLENQ